MAVMMAENSVGSMAALMAVMMAESSVSSMAVQTAVHWVAMTVPPKA